MTAPTLGGAAARLWRPTLIVVALAGLLWPPSQLPRYVYPLAFGIPLVWAGSRPSESAAFRWWALYVLGFLAFVAFRISADDVGFPVQSTYPIVADMWLGALPSAWLQAHAPAALVGWCAIGIHLSYYVAPPLVGLYLWQRTDRFPRYVAALLVIYGASLLLHVLVPTAPPWLAAERGLVSGVTRLFYALMYPDLYQYGVAVAGGNDVAAMPSVHAAVATAIALAVGRAAWLYPLLMGLALVYLGEHYLADVLAGAAIALLAWVAAARVPPLRTASR